jgi:hypothetical protein
MTQFASSDELNARARTILQSRKARCGRCWRCSSVRYRHISHYLVVNPDATSVPPAPPYTNSAFTFASGLDVVDFAVTKKLGHGPEWNLSVDNLANNHYYETQNFFDSRVTLTARVEARVHGTPGYPVGFTSGLTFRLSDK